MKSLFKMLKSALILTIAMLVLCSVIYPLTLTGVSGVVFPKQANGNLIKIDGKAVGSELIGQQFTDPRFFRGRVSSIQYNTYTKEDLIPDSDGNTAYAGVSSGGFNYGASSTDLQARVKADIEDFLMAHPSVKASDIPTDLLTASGSGLDPHISIEAAKIQIPAIAKACGLSQQQLEEIVDNNTEHKVLGVFGEDKVNVLKANIEIAKAIGIL